MKRANQCFVVRAHICECDVAYTLGDTPREVCKWHLPVQQSSTMGKIIILLPSPSLSFPHFLSPLQNGRCQICGVVILQQPPRNRSPYRLEVRHWTARIKEANTSHVSMTQEFGQQEAQKQQKRNALINTGGHPGGSSLAGEDLVDTMLNKSAKCFGTNKANDILGCIGRSAASRSRKAIFLHYSALMETKPEVLCAVLVFPHYKRNMNILKRDE